MQANVWTDAEARRWLSGLSGDEAAMYASDPMSDQDADEVEDEDEDEDDGENDEDDQGEDTFIGDDDEGEENEEDDTDLQRNSQELQTLAELLARANGTNLEALSGDALLQVYSEAARRLSTLQRGARI